MALIPDLFAKSPFGPLVEHTKKVHECVEMLWPLMEAAINEEYDLLPGLLDKVSRLEYESDKLKHAIRDNLPRRFFLPVSREDLESYLRRQDRIADGVEDFAVILTIRNTKIHSLLAERFTDFVNQIFQVTGTLLTAAVELHNLAEVSFTGAESVEVLHLIEGLGKEEWRADRMARVLSREIYNLENELDPITIIFYEKMLLKLGEIANEAENAGDLLRTMIIK